MTSLRKTKILCTLGPSSEDKETIKKMIKAGMDAARLNFSHGDEKEKKKKIDLLNEINKERERPIIIVSDLKGPEIRASTNGKKLDIKTDDKIFFTAGGEAVVDEKPFTISIDLDRLSLPKGSKIMIDDGLIEFEVLKNEGDKLLCKANNSGILCHNKGVNIPKANERIEAPTEQDWKDIEYSIKSNVDFIALSFVKEAKEVIEVKEFIGDRPIKVISKIEHQKSVDNINSIIDASDCIMIARGDLGVEVPLERLPVIQYEVVKKCNFIGKPVIVATHMLNSMIENPRPTRAEVTDVSNAVLMGADVIMLSGETANGKYPVESVKMMSTISTSMEREIRNRINRFAENDPKDVPTIVGRAVAMTASYSNASAIINITETGETSRMLSRYRIQSPIYLFTTKDDVCKKVSLFWGVFPYKLNVTGKIEDVVENGIRFLLDKEKIKKNDLVVITANVPSISGSQRSIAEVRKV